MKIAIVGRSETSLLAPRKGLTDWELWGLPWHHLNMDVYFDPHVLERSVSTVGHHYLEKLKNIEEPIYMQRHYEEIPSSVEYPLDEMIDIFGDYFQSTISYILALAISKNPEEISIFGVELNTKLEYKNQRHNIEFFKGFANGRGIEVTTPSVCRIGKYEQQFPEYPERYGWEQ